jgi:uncharacterized protein
MSSLPLPPGDESNRPHWEAAKNGQLLVQRCLSCGHTRFPASRRCEKCHSRDNEWIVCTGNGVIESFCIFHKAYWPGFKQLVPYTVVQVRLEEGVSFISNLDGGSGRVPTIGTAVKAIFEPVSDDLTLIRFTEKSPCGSGEHAL